MLNELSEVPRKRDGQNSKKLSSNRFFSIFCKALYHFNFSRNLRNHKKIRDISRMLTDYDNLMRAFDKAKKVIEKEGAPKMFIRCITELEDFVNEVCYSYQCGPCDG